ncbi:MAG: hypothetical protein KDD60_12705, partial [Bdellovibrionales bacterium]|nr:hypothetical protein [Bdellovibrionales bacterium]
AKADGCSILVTLDYGTTNHHELEFAKSLGLTTIVIDHHHVDSVPPADVFINPQQPGCGFARGDLSAAGLCWFFIVALSKLLPAKESLDPKRYLDLACLGTICDMVPLRGANRIIARRGLECLSSTERVGLRALKDVMGVGGGKRMSCSHVSFGIGPRLNAAGRMVSGDLVIELLTTESSGKAEKLAKKLHKLNQQRQATEEEVKLSAISQVDRRGGLPDGIVAWDRTYHTGVIGIVAQRLVEEFYRPSAVMGYENGFFKGSVRGIQGMSVVEVLSATSQHLEKFGGHAGAGGFSIREEMLEPFAEAFEQECAKAIREVSKEPVVNADTICDLNEITPAIVHEMKRFEPLGMGNPGPQIMLQGLEVRDVKTLKNAHLKATLSN